MPVGRIPSKYEHIQLRHTCAPQVGAPARRSGHHRCLRRARKRFNLSTTAVRVIFLLLIPLPGPILIIYLALWLIMPNGD